MRKIRYLELENGLNIKLNSKTMTAKVTYSPHAKETVLIPRSITFQNKDYIIATLNATFKDNKEISTVLFAKDTKIKTISRDAFSQSSIQSISIPSQIQKIDDSAFSDCHSLHNLEFPPDTKLISIGQLSFSKSGLKSISIPATVKFISKRAFQDCQILENVTIPPEIQMNSISELLFNQTPITVISIPSSVRIICKGAFKNCDKLQKVDIKDDSNLEIIGEDAFASTKIKKFSITSKVVSLKKSCFFGIENLNDFQISPNIKHILFYNNTYLMSKSDIKSDIFDNIHFSNYNVESIVIPSYVKYIDSSAFNYRQKLKTVTFLNDSQIQLIDDRAFYCSSVEEVVIQPHIKIGEECFKYCDKLKKIQCNEPDSSMPTQICEIGQKCFYYCEELMQIELLANELILGNDCFNYLENIAIVSFPNAEKIFIGENIFKYCSNRLTLFVKTGSQINGSFEWEGIFMHLD